MAMIFSLIQSSIYPWMNSAPNISPGNEFRRLGPGLDRFFSHQPPGKTGNWGDKKTDRPEPAKSRLGGV
jgi:hypothetical protein